MDLVERLRAWSFDRQRLGRPARSAAEALRAVVAVYATHPTSPLALRARTRSLTPDAYRRLDRDRRGLRIPGMRGTVFLVPASDAGRVFAAVGPVSSRILRTLKRYAFTERDYERHARRILDAAREPTRSIDLQDAAGLKGQALGTILRCLRYDGRMLALAGPSMHSDAHRYVATDAWAPGSLDGPDPDEAMVWLAGAYLRAYGPARVEDFAWGAGVTTRVARDALARHRTVDVGDGMLLPVRDRPAFGAVRKVRGSVVLLPKWDAYTMGHAPDGRQRLVHPDLQEAVYSPVGVGLTGDGNPVILVDGQVAAIWTYTLKDGPTLRLLDSLGPTVRRKVDRELEAIASFLAG